MVKIWRKQKWVMILSIWNSVRNENWFEHSPSSNNGVVIVEKETELYHTTWHCCKCYLHRHANLIAIYVFQLLESAYIMPRWLNS